MGDPGYLTLREKLAGRQVAERAVGTVMVVVEAPCFDLCLRVGERIVDEVHAPPVRGPDGSRRRTAMERAVLSPPHTHAELQALQTVEAPHAFAIHRPALATQQDPDAQIPKTRPRVRELANPQ